MKFKIAVRNLLRNTERSLLSLLMISGSIVGLVLFKAFTDNSMVVVEEVSTEMNFGHLQIAKKTYWKNTNLPRGENIIKDPADLIKKVEKIAEVKSISGRIGSFGLLSSGEKTENASLMGFNDQVESGIQRALLITEGAYFSKMQHGEILVGHLLAHRLGLKIGEEVTIVVNTVRKVVNAGDFKVVGFFATSTEEIDKYFAYVGLSDLQQLIQSDGVDYLVIKLNNSSDLSVASSKIAHILNESYPDSESRDWMSLSELFRKVKKFYEAQNLIIQSILIFIVVLGILNTIGMSVLERIGEIGTLRSMGSTNTEIYQLFLLECLALVVTGILIGSVGAFGLGSLINASGITTEIPGASLPVPIRFVFTASGFLRAGTLIFLSTIIASLLPISKGLRISIVEALRRNI